MPHVASVYLQGLFLRRGMLGGGGGPGRGSCWGGAALPSWYSSKEARSVCSCVEGGKEAGRFALLLLSPLLAYSWDLRRKAWPEGLVAAGRGGRGVSPPSVLHLFHGSLSLAQSGAGKPAAAEAGAGKERWGEGDQRARDIPSPPPRRGTRSPGHVQGLKQGEWSNQFSDKAIYYPTAAGFSVCPVSPGDGGAGRGKASFGCT